MQKYFSVLQNCSLFLDIEEGNLMAMLNCLGAKVSTYAKGQPIFLEGEAASYVGIVLSGQVQVIKEDFNGNRNILTSVQPSQLFGEVFACAEIAHLPVSVMATSESQIMLLACKQIITTCNSSCVFHNRVIHNLLRIVAAKNLLLNQKIEFLSQRTTKEKLMAYLFAQAKQNHSTTFTIPYNRQALADYLGVDRSAMSAELSKLQQEGRIQFQKNHFTLL